MNSILIVDCETTGLDPATDAVLEIGAVRWSVEHRTILECWSTLLAHDPPRENSAELVNRIPSAALKKAMPARAAMLSLQDMAVECDAVVAHNADFDASFLPVLKGSRWICSMNDIE